MPSVMSGGNLAPSLQRSMVVAAPCCGDVSAAGTGRLVRIEGKINRAKYREILDENPLQSAQDLTGTKVHLPTGQQPKAQALSQDHTRVASGQVSECP